MENPSESDSSEQLIARVPLATGMRLLRSGWPDFLAVDEISGRAVGLEVKDGVRFERPGLTSTQRSLLPVLVGLGLPCVIVTQQFAEMLERSNGNVWRAIALASQQGCAWPVLQEDRKK